jgi:hypothetical protein
MQRISIGDPDSPDRSARPPRQVGSHPFAAIHRHGELGKSAARRSTIEAELDQGVLVNHGSSEDLVHVNRPTHGTPEAQERTAHRSGGEHATGATSIERDQDIDALEILAADLGGDRHLATGAFDPASEERRIREVGPARGDHDSLIRRLLDGGHQRPLGLIQQTIARQVSARRSELIGNDSTFR